MSLNIPSYTGNTWVDNSSPDLSAENLNKTEEGIRTVTDGLNNVVGAITNQYENDPNKIAGAAAVYELNSNLASVIRITKNFTNSGGNAYVGIDTTSYTSGKKLKTSPCILVTINAATDPTLGALSIRRENDNYFTVFLNKAAAASFNVNAQFLVE